MEILSTLIDVDVDEAWVAGRHLTRGADAVRSAIGVTGQFSAVDNLLTAEENLLLMADLYHLDRREGKRRAKDLMRRFDLSEVAGKTAVTFSGGMRRKLDLAMTLVGDPRIIFLDEPTTGLDPRSRLHHVGAIPTSWTPCAPTPHSPSRQWKSCCATSAWPTHCRGRRSMTSRWRANSSGRARR